MESCSLALPSPVLAAEAEEEDQLDLASLSVLEFSMVDTEVFRNDCSLQFLSCSLCTRSGRPLIEACYGLGVVWARITCQRIRCI